MPAIFAGLSKLTRRMLTHSIVPPTPILIESPIRGRFLCLVVVATRNKFVVPASAVLLIQNSSWTIPHIIFSWLIPLQNLRIVSALHLLKLFLGIKGLKFLLSVISPWWHPGVMLFDLMVMGFSKWSKADLPGMMKIIMRIKMKTCLLVLHIVEVKGRSGLIRFSDEFCLPTTQLRLFLPQISYLLW